MDTAKAAPTPRVAVVVGSTRPGRSPFTVKTHAVRAMTKVGARDRAQLVAFTFHAGLYP